MVEVARFFSRTPTVHEQDTASYDKWEGDIRHSRTPTYYSPENDLAYTVGVRLKWKGVPHF